MTAQDVLDWYSECKTVIGDNQSFAVNDGIFQGDTKEKVAKILEKVKGAKLMKVKQGVLGLEGNKYFVWKDWGPLAWWDFDEKDKKVVDGHVLDDYISVLSYLHKT